MTELTATERALRVIVAQHLPGIPSDLFGAYANHIHPATPFGKVGLLDLDVPALRAAVQDLYGVNLPDEAWAKCGCVRDLAAVVDQLTMAEAA